MASIVNYKIFATGGAVLLYFVTAETGTVTITRTRVSDSTTWTLYSGSPPRVDGQPAIYLDTGDDGSVSALAAEGTQLSSWLDPTQLYTYSVTDSAGTASTPELQIASGALITTPDVVPQVLKLLTIGMRQISLPAGWKPPIIAQAPPEGMMPTVPFITMYPGLLEQADQPIGRSVGLSDQNDLWTIYEQAHHGIIISVVANNSAEMLFYRDATIALLKFIVAEFMSPIGQDSWHTYKAKTFTDVDQTRKMVPSFYRCEILFEWKGEFNASIQSQYGLIEHIDMTASDSQTGLPDVNVVVPLTG